MDKVTILLAYSKSTKGTHVYKTDKKEVAITQMSLDDEAHRPVR